MGCWLDGFLAEYLHVEGVNLIMSFAGEYSSFILDPGLLGTFIRDLDKDPGDTLVTSVSDAD